MANDILKSRKDAKLNQMQNFSRLGVLCYLWSEISGNQSADRS